MPIETGHVDGGIGIGPQVPVGNIGRKVIHQLPRNPADVTMLVSVLPKEIKEWKPTIFPGEFIIPAAIDGGFSLLKIEGTSWYLPSAIERMAPLEIQVNSLALAQAIVRDYASAIFESNSTQGPGLFYIPGEWTEKTILGYVDRVTKHTFTNILDSVRAKQKRWFLAIIASADKEWARTNGSPIAITDDARLGAELLNLKDKPWMKDIQAAQLAPCPACGTMVNMNFAICMNCKTIVNQAKAKELGLIPPTVK